MELEWLGEGRRERREKEYSIIRLPMDVWEKMYHKRELPECPYKIEVEGDTVTIYYSWA